ncbi:hypothetical protein Btru_046118 [Bulinus truncatus]|nr:hypothetical protein Btru_046118 [Bulinus truncatus]
MSKRPITSKYKIDSSTFGPYSYMKSTSHTGDKEDDGTVSPTLAPKPPSGPPSSTYKRKSPPSRQANTSRPPSGPVRGVSPTRRRDSDSETESTLGELPNKKSPMLRRDSRTSQTRELGVRKGSFTRPDSAFKGRASENGPRRLSENKGASAAPKRVTSGDIVDDNLLISASKLDSTLLRLFANNRDSKPKKGGARDGGEEEDDLIPYLNYSESDLISMEPVRWRVFPMEAAHKETLEQEMPYLEDNVQPYGVIKTLYDDDVLTHMDFNQFTREFFFYLTSSHDTGVWVRDTTHDIDHPRGRSVTPSRRPTFVVPEINIREGTPERPSSTPDHFKSSSEDGVQSPANVHENNKDSKRFTPEHKNNSRPRERGYTPEKSHRRQENRSYLPELVKHKVENSRYIPEQAQHKPEDNQYRTEDAEYKREDSIYKPEHAKQRPNDDSYKTLPVQRQPEDSSYKPEHVKYKPEDSIYKPEHVKYKPEDSSYKTEYIPHKPDEDRVFQTERTEHIPNESKFHGKEATYEPEEDNYSPENTENLKSYEKTRDDVKRHPETPARGDHDYERDENKNAPPSKMSKRPFTSKYKIDSSTFGPYSYMKSTSHTGDKEDDVMVSPTLAPKQPSGPPGSTYKRKSPPSRQANTSRPPSGPVRGVSPTRRRDSDSETESTLGELPNKKSPMLRRDSRTSQTRELGVRKGSFTRPDSAFKGRASENGPRRLSENKGASAAPKRVTSRVEKATHRLNRSRLSKSSTLSISYNHSDIVDDNLLISASKLDSTLLRLFANNRDSKPKKGGSRDGGEEEDDLIPYLNYSESDLISMEPVRWRVFPMEAAHKETLEQEMPYIEDNVQPYGVIKTLYDDDVLTHMDFNQFTRTEGQGDRAVTRLLVKTLQRRGNKAYPAFVDALRVNEYPHVSNRLEETERAIRQGMMDDRIGASQTPGKFDFKPTPPPPPPPQPCKSSDFFKPVPPPPRVAPTTPAIVLSPPHSRQWGNEDHDPLADQHPVQPQGQRPESEMLVVDSKDLEKHLRELSKELQAIQDDVDALRNDNNNIVPNKSTAIPVSKQPIKEAPEIVYVSDQPKSRPQKSSACNVL